MLVKTYTPVLFLPQV